MSGEESYDPSKLDPCLRDYPRPINEIEPDDDERGGDDESHHAGRRPWRGGLKRAAQNQGEGEV